MATEPSDDNLEPLTPVHSPISMRWREVRISILPALTFVVVLVTIVFLWRHVSNSSGVQAVAEGVRANVAAPNAGTLSSVLVRPYQTVTEGEPIAILQSTDPRVAMDVLNIELQIAQLRLQPTLAESSAVDFERLRIELFRTQAEFVAAKVNLNRAENDVKRSQPLFQERLLSEDLYELSVTTRDLYRAEVHEKSNAVASITQRIADLKFMQMPEEGSPQTANSEVLKQLEHLLVRATNNLQPVTIRAPISGMVSAVYHQSGENVVDGEPIVTINSTWSDRLVAYMRQPYPVDPQQGLPVRIFTRGRHLQKFDSVVSEVGSQVEVITNALAIIKQGVLIDVGLPMVISVPAEAKIRPGEVLDIVFLSSARETADIPPPKTSVPIISERRAMRPREEELNTYNR